MSDVKIYVVGSHKNKFLELGDTYTKFYIDEQHNGDNIDDRNPYYCETTGLYYIWKNENSDIKGLAHYRRYFGNTNTRKPLTETEIKEILDNHDMIVTRGWDAGGPTLEWRFHRGWAEGRLDAEIKYLKFAMKYLHPECYEEFEQFIQTTTHWQFNMLIAKKDLFDKYCQWLFEILDIVWTKKDELKKRGIGYLSEVILLSFYIHINKLNVYNAPLLFVR